jgi:hypothetical protein
LIARLAQDRGELAGRCADLEHMRWRWWQRAEQRPEAVTVEPKIFGFAIGPDAAPVGFDNLAWCHVLRILLVMHGWCITQ